MYIRKLKLTLLAAATTFLPLAAAAQTVPTNEELSQRIDGIESKLDALIKLMTEGEKASAARQRRVAKPPRSRRKQKLHRVRWG